VYTLVSLTERDHVDALIGADALAAFAGALRDAGLSVDVHREATPEDAREFATSWARRLGIPQRRRAWLLVARWESPNCG
jgi:hypothetical protein